MYLKAIPNVFRLRSWCLYLKHCFIFIPVCVLLSSSFWDIDTVSKLLGQPSYVQAYKVSKTSIFSLKGIKKSLRIVYYFILVRVWRKLWGLRCHSRIRFWEQPVLSKEDKGFYSRNQRMISDGVRIYTWLAIPHLQFRCANRTAPIIVSLPSYKKNKRHCL